MEIELEKKRECIQNTRDEFKGFFKNKKYNITEDEQQIKVLYKGHEVVLKENAPNDEYLMGANAGWTLKNYKDKSKHTIALNIKKNDDEYSCGYKLICDTDYTIKYPEFKNMQELLEYLFGNL